MDVAGSAVSIVSLGIQVCQGLLDYYDSWRGYKTDVNTAHECIADLCQTFTLLQESLGFASLDQARAARVKACLDSCVGGLEKLQNKLEKLRAHSVPSGFRQKAWAEAQRLYYPFKESTLAKLRELVGDLRERLSLALQILHLDLGSRTQDSLSQIEGSVAHIVSQNQSLSHHVHDILTTQQAEHFRKIIDWLSPPDPFTNHASARRHHEPQTGSWLLQSDQYKRWKDGYIRHLWLYGKVGCGKTVLSSTVIEDLRRHCENGANFALAVFYFSFSNSRKQSFESLLRSVVARVGWKEPGRSMLQREYDKRNRSLPGPEALEEILLSSIGQSAMSSWHWTLLMSVRRARKLAARCWTILNDFPKRRRI